MKGFKKLATREKVLITVTIACTATAGYFGYKYISDHKQIVKLADDTNTLMAAASEGVFEEALGTLNHKITYRADKEKYPIEYLNSHPNENKTKETLEKVRVELTNLYNRKDKIEKAQHLYEIKTEV